MDSKQFRNMTQEEFDKLYYKITQYIIKYQKNKNGDFPLYKIVCMDLGITLVQLKVIQQLYPKYIKFHNTFDFEKCKVEYIYPKFTFSEDNIQVINDD